jgi:hypothetical protein
MHLRVRVQVRSQLHLPEQVRDQGGEGTLWVWQEYAPPPSPANRPAILFFIISYLL